MWMLEYAAAAFGLACVALTVRQNVLCWPTGLVMVALYLVVFYQARLYSDMLLQGVYIVLQVYGWYAWVYGGTNRSALAVTRTSPREMLAWGAVCLVGTAALGGTMRAFTDASLPFLDAFTTSASLVAQWLLGRKRLESWLFWIVVDVVSIGVYLAKGLYPTTGLYAIFLCLAVWGFFEWKRTLPVAEPA
jgi:nicotinamide mononucleotide transporter